MNALLADLNGPQREAVLHEHPPLLLLAGAGSGKTRVVTTRIAWWLAQGRFRPSEVLALTFTNKAAREMGERVARLCPPAEGEAPLMKTFHSFGAWLLRRWGRDVGLGPQFTIYDEDDSLALVRSLAPGLPAAEHRALSRAIARAKDQGLSPATGASASRLPGFAGLFEAYEARLAGIGNTDFAGLIGLAVRLLETQPELRARLQNRFRLVLVDEYQDTNSSQFDLLRLLTGPDTWLCAVGDDDQSIYRFRGAEVSHILDFDKRFPGTRVIRLEQNYRSTGHILAQAASVVSHNTGRLGKTLWTEAGDGRPPQLLYTADEYEESERIAAEIAARPEVQTAVVYRTNAQSRVLETTLTRRGLRFSLVGGQRFYEREEVKDALAWLAFLANPRDPLALARSLTKPARGLGPAALEKIADGAQQSGGDYEAGARLILDRLKGKARQGLTAWLLLLEDLRRRLVSEPLAQVLLYLIRESGLEAHYEARDEERGLSKGSNLEELANAAIPYGSGPEALALFLENLELAGADDPAEGGASTVLITMHNTKGLEFDRVFITGLEEGLFPREGADPEELEEERRLFYVAITRARRELTFSCAGRRSLHGRTEDRRPSRFLDELDPARLQIVGRQPPKPAPSGWAVGARVYHDDYGVGWVTKVWSNATDTAIRVRFESGAQAQFIPAYTPLERLGQGED